MYDIPSKLTFEYSNAVVVKELKIDITQSTLLRV